VRAHSLSLQASDSMFQRDPRAGAFLGGDRVSGQDIRDQNGAFKFNYCGFGLTKYSANPNDR
jgi:hypothetical protein